MRYACAFDHHIAQGVRKILVRAIASFYRRAVSTKDVKAEAGAIVFTQRFESRCSPDIPCQTSLVI